MQVLVTDLQALELERPFDTDVLNDSYSCGIQDGHVVPQILKQFVRPATGNFSVLC